MNIIVLGGGGYVGSVLVEHISSLRHEFLPVYQVKVIDRFYFGNKIKKRDNVSTQQRDICDLTADDFRQAEVVVDLAGISNDPACDLDEGMTWRINYEGMRNAAKCAKDAGVKHYIYSSSCSVYGDTKDDIVKEEAILAPLSTYAIVKAHCEDYLRGLSKNGFHVTLLRNATVFGESDRMRFDLIVNLMTLHAFKNKKIFVLGGGNQWRPLVHVSDIAEIIENIIRHRDETANQTYNVSYANYQPRTIAKMIKNRFPEVEALIVPDDPDKRNYRVDNSKLKTITNCHVSRDVEYGISSMYRHLSEGSIKEDITTNTVGYYKYLISTEKLIQDLSIGGRLFKEAKC